MRPSDETSRAIILAVLFILATPSPNSAKETHAVQKCCPLGEGVSYENCTKTDNELKVKLYQSNNTHYWLLDPDSYEVAYIVRDPCENKKFYLQPDDYEEDRHFLFTNGSLYIQSSVQILSPNNYCIDSGPNGLTQTYVCFVATSSASTPILRTTFLLASCFALILTICGLQKHQKSKKTTLLTCFTAAMLAAFFLLAVLQILPEDTPQALCNVMGPFMQFFFVWCHVWLFIIILDTYLNLRYDNVDYSAKLKIAIAISTFVSSILLVANIALALSSENTEAVYHGFGNSRCWKQTPSVALIIFYAPLCVIWLGGLVVLIKIMSKVKKIFGANNYDKVVENYKPGVRWNTDEHYVRAIVFIFVIATIFLIMEIVSIFLGSHHVLWTVLESLIALKGILIFIVFLSQQQFTKPTTRQQSSERATEMLRDF